MNSRMAELGAPAVGTASTVDLDPRLAAILADGLADIGPCVVLAHHLDAVAAAEIDSFPDATGFEAFINHVHLDEELALPAADPAVLAQAGRYATGLSELLATEHPGDDFVLILAVSDSCVVRFHKLRSGEAWVADDLEGYEHKAVLVARLPLSDAGGRGR
jgi:hypothetical protein